jgi:hypothetical protein
LRGAWWPAAACGVLLAWPGLACGQDAPALDADASQEEAIAEETAERSLGPLTLGPLHLSIFVDAYAAWQTSGKGTLATRSKHRAFSGQGASLRAENGFGLSFLGFDVQYDAGRFGVVANLRFGQAAAIFHGENDALFGVEYLTQAYAFYRPWDALQLDLGMFISPFGYEALESWKNPNYTISALYVYGQPNWHTGLRATWQVDDTLSVMAMIVDGANNISETQQNGGLDQKPMLGGTLSYQPVPALLLALSALVAVDRRHNDDEGLDAFVDLVATFERGAWTSALNLDSIFTRDGAPRGGNRNFVGGSLTSAYRVNDIVGLAARAELMRDDASFDGSDVWQLATATLTLDLRPIPRLSYLIMRLESRWEKSNQRIYGQDSQGSADTADDSYRRTWFEGVFGVVVTTDP